MKTFLKYIAHISVILNAYYHIAWLAVCNTGIPYPERVKSFHRLTLNIHPITLLLPTLISLVFYIVYAKDHKWAYIFLAGLQALFLALHVLYLL